MKEEGCRDLRSFGLCEWLALGLMGLILVGWSAYFFPAFRGFISSSTTAAWVQALGSILALGVAIYLSNKGDVERRRERIRDDHEKMRVASYDLLALALELCSHAYQLQRLSKEDVDRTFFISETWFFKDFQRRLSQCTFEGIYIPHKTLGIEIREVAVELMEHVVARSSGSKPSDTDWNTLLDRADNLYEQVKMTVPRKEVLS